MEDNRMLKRQNELKKENYVRHKLSKHTRNNP